MRSKPRRCDRARPHPRGAACLQGRRAPAVARVFRPGCGRDQHRHPCRVRPGAGDRERAAAPWPLTTRASYPTPWTQVRFPTGDEPTSRGGSGHPSSPSASYGKCTTPFGERSSTRRTSSVRCFRAMLASLGRCWKDWTMPGARRGCFRRLPPPRVARPEPGVAAPQQNTKEGVLISPTLHGSYIPMSSAALAKPFRAGRTLGAMLEDIVYGS